MRAPPPAASVMVSGTPLTGSGTQNVAPVNVTVGTAAFVVGLGLGAGVRALAGDARSDAAANGLTIAVGVTKICNIIGAGTNNPISCN